MAHYGKKQAGRLLDGREWNEFPDVTAIKPVGKLCRRTVFVTVLPEAERVKR